MASFIQDGSFCKPPPPRHSRLAPKNSILNRTNKDLNNIVITDSQLYIITRFSLTNIFVNENLVIFSAYLSKASLFLLFLLILSNLSIIFLSLQLTGVFRLCNWFLKILSAGFVFLIQEVTFLVSEISRKTGFNYRYQDTDLFTFLT